LLAVCSFGLKCVCVCVESARVRVRVRESARERERERMRQREGERAREREGGEALWGPDGVGPAADVPFHRVRNTVRWRRRA
jgi:hypothetical protein